MSRSMQIFLTNTILLMICGRGTCRLVFAMAMVSVFMTSAQSQIRKQDYPFLAFSVGPDVSLVLNKPWANAEEGIGFRQGLGGSIRTEYHFNPSVAAVLQGGYHRWGVERNHYLGEELTDQRVSSLSTIPLGVGIKLRFAASRVYILPAINVNLYSSKYSDLNGVSMNQNGATPSVSFALGSEIHRGRGFADVSVFYQYLFHPKLESQSGALQAVGIRIAAGWRTQSLRSVEGNCPRIYY